MYVMFLLNFFFLGVVQLIGDKNGNPLPQDQSIHSLPINTGSAAAGATLRSSLQVNNDSKKNDRKSSSKLKQSPRRHLLRLL
jgi:hypothetical protein